MTDELQLLREVFQDEVAPDARASELLDRRLQSAFSGQERSIARPRRMVRSRHIVRERLALIAAAAAVVVGGVVVSINGIGTQSVAFASPFRLASYVTIPGFQASSQSIQFANNVTCPTSTDCYLEARFMNAPTAVAGNNIYFSGDGGGSWQQLILPSGVYADTTLSCTSSQQCSFGGGKFNGVDSNGKPIMVPVLVSTSNGGSSWGVARMPLPNGSFQLWGNVSVASLQCGSASDCSAVLWANFGGPGLNTVVDNVFVRTTDSGETWSSTILPGQPAPSAQGTTEPSVQSINTNAMSCPTTEFCIASTVISSSAGTKSIVWRTEDGGASWSLATLPNGLVSDGPISCPDAQHCWTIAWPLSSNDTGQLLESNDGGASWVDRSPSGNSPSTSWVTASCPTDNNCWLAGKTTGSDSASVVYASSDAGQTWTEAPLPTSVGADSAPLKGIDTIDCNANLTCIVLGIPKGVSEDGVNEAVLTNAAGH